MTHDRSISPRPIASRSDGARLRSSYRRRCDQPCFRDGSRVRPEGASGFFERLALFVALCLCAPFAILTFQLATGLPPLFTSAVPFKGPVLIAIYAFTTVLATAVIGDARVVLASGICGVPRISRHLWRMCLGLSLAAGSGFTNGFARLLPGPYHVPTSFFLPQFLPLGLLVFWMIRVRSAAWRQP